MVAFSAKDRAMFRIIETLRFCPTCNAEMVLEEEDKSTILRCPALFHGKFTLTFVQGSWMIMYNLRAQQLINPQPITV